MAVIAHPNGYQSNITTELLRCADGIEIWNGQKDSRYIPRYNLLMEFRAQQNINPKLFGLAGADLHDLTYYFPLDVVIEGGQLHKAGIFAALRDGRYFLQGKYWKIRHTHSPYHKLLFLFSARIVLNLLRGIRDFFGPHGS